MYEKIMFLKMLVALAITAVIPSWSFAAEQGRWDGFITGQAGAPMVTDYVASEKVSKESESKYVWNGFVEGQAGKPMKVDQCILPTNGSRVNADWNGYMSGSMNVVWTQNLQR